jgi:hypothetical protein
MGNNDDIFDEESTQGAIQELLDCGVPKHIAVKAIDNVKKIAEAMSVIDEADDDKAGEQQVRKAAGFLAGIRFTTAMARIGIR